MIDAARGLPGFFSPPYEASEIYSQRRSVDLGRDFTSYDFERHQADKKDSIRQLFDLTVTRSSGEALSLRSFLQSDIYHDQDAKLFEQIGFRQLNPNPSTGITLEHPSFEGWLIKKNYGYIVSEGVRKIRVKAVVATNIPRWMLTPRMIAAKEAICGVKVRNDAINPLRVVMLERGRVWIEKLGLENLRTATEYLYSLSDSPTSSSSTDVQKPLHDRVVVISRKVNILSNGDNIQRYAYLAQCDQPKLRSIAAQICLFITCNPLTDLALHNIRFGADNDTADTLFFIDGEPIGWLANVYDQLTGDSLQQYDQGFFPILGLRKLQASISDQMRNMNVPQASINAVQAIFDEAIEKRIQTIILERKWHLFKTSALTQLQGAAILMLIITVVQFLFLSEKLPQNLLIVF